MDDDEFDFEASLSQLSSSGRSGSRSTNSSLGISSTASSSVSKGRRTKSQRRKMQRERKQNNENPSEAGDTNSMATAKSVRFSLSPPKLKRSESVSSNASSSLTSNASARFRSKRTKLKKEQQIKNKRPEQNEDESSLSLASFEQAYQEDSSSFASSITSPQRRVNKKNIQRVERSYSRTQPQLTPSTVSLSSQRPGQDRVLPMNASQESSSSPTEVAVRGAGTDVVAVQDAGSYQMLYDDCSYLCSAIQSNPSTDACCDLALLLSSPKTRAALLATYHAKTNALDAILEVVASCGNAVPTLPSFRPLLQLEESGWSMGEKKEEPEMEGIDGQSSVASVSEPSVKLGGRTRTGRNKRKAEDDDAVPSDRLSMLPLTAMVHFLSWDCTMHGPHSSSPSASAACKVRDTIMQHGGALRALCQVILQDPLVHWILSSEMQQSRPKYPEEGPLTVQAEANSDRIASSEEDAVKQTSSLKQDVASVPSNPMRSDPASIGRKNRRKRSRLAQTIGALNAIPEDGEDDADRTVLGPPLDQKMEFVFEEGSSNVDNESIKSKKDDASATTADTGTLSKVADKLVELQERLKGGNTLQYDHTCAILEESHCSKDSPLGLVALNALNRIVTGKEGEDPSCIEVAAEDSDTVRHSPHPNNDKDEEDEQLKTNPLLMTNTRLRECGSLPLLARAMSETLSAVAVLLRHASNSESFCIGCLLELQQRLMILAALVDGACCLTAENRRDLCCSETAPLVSSLLLTIQTFSDRMEGEISNLTTPEAALLRDIGLSSLRTLTSLTHDNEIAAQQLAGSYRTRIPSQSSVQAIVGTEALIDLLYRTVQSRLTKRKTRPTGKTSPDHHFTYDMIIFCLNTLTNAVSVRRLRELLAQSSIENRSEGRSSSPFLKWLSTWLVEETESFRDAIMKSSFGDESLENRSAEMRHLEKDEEDQLVLAGNGFILLACLVKEWTTSDAAEQRLNKEMREMILNEMPASSDEGASNGLRLIKNTLKAFCNFYHFSVGELSVAVVAPVGQLIADLDRIET